MTRNDEGVIHVERKRGKGCVGEFGVGELRSNVQNGVKNLVRSYRMLVIEVVV